MPKGEKTIYRCGTVLLADSKACLQTCEGWLLSGTPAGREKSASMRLLENDIAEDSEPVYASVYAL